MGKTARKRSSSSLDIELECDPSVEVGDFVYIDTDSIVKQADASDQNKMPAIGYVAKKKSNGKALVVQTFLEEETQAEPRKPYFISTSWPGKLQDTPPSTKDHVCQRVGVGISSTTRLIQIDPNLAVVRS